MKGYTQNQFGILGVPGTVFCGIVFPIALIIFAYQAFPRAAGMAALVLAIPIILSIYRLLTGPYWYHRR